MRIAIRFVRGTVLSTILVTGSAAEVLAQGGVEALFLLPTAVDAETGQPGNQPTQYVVRLATIAPPDIAYTKYAAKILVAIERRSGGRMKFVLLAGAAAGDEPDIVAKLKKGELQGALVTIVGIQQMVPAASAFSLPFLYSDEDEFSFILDRNRNILRTMFRDQGFELHVFENIGFVDFFSTVPIHNLNELYKLRAWSWKGEAIMPAWMEHIGWSSRVPHGLHEVEKALAARNVDVAFANPASIVLLGWYPHLCCWLRLSGVAGPNVVAFASSRARWTAFPDDLKRIVQEEIAGMLPHVRKWLLRDNEIAMLGLYKRGLKITDPPQSEVDALKKTAEKFWWEQADKLYPKWLLEKILKDREEYRARRRAD